ncbi:MAG: RNA polymerase sigma factor [Gemmatimonadales bacterium]
MTKTGPRGSTRADADAADALLATSGDARAFERLYQGHVARIHSLARRMIGVDEADDVTQDVFVRAWNRLDSFRGDSAFGTWLYRLAINLILGKRESLARRRGRTQEGDEIFDRIEGRRDDRAMALDFEAAIERLPPRAREVFVLHDVEGFKHREIAQQLGVTTGTSKAQLHRARMALRNYVER